MQITTNNQRVSLPVARRLKSPEAGGQPPTSGDGFQASNTDGTSPNSGKAAAIATGLAYGTGVVAVIMTAGSAGAMAGATTGTAAGTIAGGMVGSALGIAGVGLATVGLVNLTKKSPMLAFGLLSAGAAVAVATSSGVVGAAGVALASCAPCTAGGPFAGLVAGLGGGLIVLAALKAAQK